MANLKSLFSSSSLLIITKIIPKERKTHLQGIPALSLSAANKWTIPDDLNLTSTPSSHDYLTGHCSFADDSSNKQNFKEIRCVLRDVGEDLFEGLALIDALQRLGIDHHFQEEIQASLGCQHKKFSNGSHSKDGLYEVSTRFRLLRQEGYNVNPGVFGKFMTKEGKLKSELSRDIRGLMGLYEASQLSMEGEDMFDHAGESSAKLLNMWMTDLDHLQARIVGNTLRHPYHKSLPIFMAKDFIRDNKFQNKWVNILEEQTKFELDFVRTMQNKEIFQVSEWWKDTGLAKELKFARNQPLKWYMWPAVALMDPSLSDERIDLTKPISFIYIIDDIYDVYGTLNELTLFTEAINRWDLAAIEKLPDYMKFCFKALDNITNEISCKIYRKHGVNPVDSLRKTWGDLCEAFLAEAKSFASGQSPRAEEYLQNGVISSGAHIVLVHMFFLLGHGLNKESINAINNNPGILNSGATILRLWDDLGSAKDENQDGNDGSFVKCYMKDTNCSAETARKQVNKMISDSWKRLNKETLSPGPFSATFRKGCLNLARMVPLMYSYDENSSLPILQKHMKSILFKNMAQ